LGQRQINFSPGKQKNMSHYTVMVLGHDPEEQLAAFNENIDACSLEDLSFSDSTPEFEREFQHGQIEAWQLPSGQFLLNQEESESEFALTGPTPSGAIRVSVPPCKIYPDLDSFVQDYHQQSRHPENGKYGYFFNPQARWDWYQLGGRWTGFFKLKPNREGTTGEPGIFTSTPKPGFADQALKGDIDFEGMRQQNEREARQMYDEAMKILGNLPPNLSWMEISKEYQEEEQDRDLARQIYWSQPRCLAWKKHKGDEYHSPDPFLKDRQEFIRSAGNRAWMTFALLDHGNWQEQGHMGWFGVATDKSDESDWCDVINKALQQVPEDTLISVYDCHI
jgi:hypothetical protein